MLVNTKNILPSRPSSQDQPSRKLTPSNGTSPPETSYSPNSNLVSPARPRVDHPGNVTKLSHQVTPPTAPGPSSPAAAAATSRSARPSAGRRSSAPTHRCSTADPRARGGGDVHGPGASGGLGRAHGGRWMAHRQAVCSGSSWWAPKHVGCCPSPAMNWARTKPTQNTRKTHEDERLEPNPAGTTASIAILCTSGGATSVASFSPQRRV